MEETNKLKISSDFLIEKGILIIAILIVLLLLSDFNRTETGFPTGHLISIPCLIGLLWLLFTRPAVYYNEDFMFIKKGKDKEAKIPLENIQSIKLSALGFQRNGGSWLVKYFDDNSELKTIRIFPSIFSNPFSKFIKSVKSKKPNISIRNWTFGINEVFD